jgi:hypothetical protein
MARMYKALCERDTVMDNPYQYFKAGKEYYISEDCPVAVHFRPLEQLPAKETEKVIEEGIISPDQIGKPKAVRKSAEHWAEAGSRK